MRTPPVPTLGALLRRARRAAGLTQEQLAERAGVSVDLISKVEREVTRAPQQYTLDQLPRFLTKAPGFDLEPAADGSRSKRLWHVDGHGRAALAARPPRSV